MGNCPCYEFIWGREKQSLVLPAESQRFWRIGEGTHRIVVGIGAKDFEGSKKSLSFALQLANRGDELLVCHIQSTPGDMRSRLVELEKSHAAEIAAKDITYETSVSEGNPRQQLLQKSLRAEMLVVGGGHKGFGSMTRFVCEYATVNVLVVKKHVSQIGKILVGVGANDLYGSLSALKLAFDIANSGEEITALYIPVSTNVAAGNWKVRAPVQSDSLKSFAEGRKANDVIKAVRERGNALIQTFKDEGKKVQFHFEYKEGEFDRTAVRTELMNAAKSARLVVLGAGSKGFGSVARYVVENIECCPVILAKFVRAQSHTGTETDV